MTTTRLCINGDGNPAQSRRRVCLSCYLERARQLAKTAGRKPHKEVEDMTMDEFERQYEPREERRRVER